MATNLYKESQEDPSIYFLFLFWLTHLPGLEHTDTFFQVSLLKIYSYVLPKYIKVRKTNTSKVSTQPPLCSKPIPNRE